MQILKTIKMLCLAANVWALAHDASAAQPIAVRVAHMPNVTHTQAVIARANGWFQKKLGPGVDVQWRSFNAGPSIIEGIFAGQIDIAYVGPGPAINGYARSEGQALQIIAGAASGGAAFVVRKGVGIKGVGDLPGKKIATPQLGNTQDIALRQWMLKAGLKSREKGGAVSVQPMANADQLTLFVKGALDGAWTVEPWVSRLEQEGGGEILFEESSLWPQTKGMYATTVLVVRKQFLAEHPKVVSDWVRAHVALTSWVNAGPEDARMLFNQELAREVGKPLPDAVLKSAFSRLQFTVHPVKESVMAYADAAFGLGFLGRKRPNLEGLFRLDMLQADAQAQLDILSRSKW